MKINASSIALASSAINIKSSTTYERLRKWDKTSDVTTESSVKNGQVEMLSISRKDIKAELPPLPDSKANPPVPAEKHHKKDKIKEMMSEYAIGIKLQIMKAAIEALTGKEIEVFDAGDMQDTGEDPVDVPAQDPNQGAQGNTEVPDWGIDYYYKETNYSKEGVAFSASGSVTTEDGRKIDFKVTVEMSREKYEEIELSVKDGAAKIDPLIVDLSGGGAGFINAKFDFDLNSDGVNESIYTPKTGSGFLAYDKNGNGIIDDGSELFGPSSGNGFSELSAMDGNNDGWIDENDAAFVNMKIWRKGSDGTDIVQGLKESGVGAIYTRSVATNFDLTAKPVENNTPNQEPVAGTLRETGIVIKEDGTTGLIQEIDLSI